MSEAAIACPATVVVYRPGAGPEHRSVIFLPVVRVDGGAEFVAGAPPPSGKRPSEIWPAREGIGHVRPQARKLIEVVLGAYAHGRAATKDEIQEAIWGQRAGDARSSSALPSAATAANLALARADKPWRIKAVHGVGYRLVALEPAAS